MNLGLAGKLFIVGGGSRGLGRAVAEALIDEGARVILVSRDQGALEDLAAALGDGAVPFAADLADPASVDA
ncbi:MAG TPA: SDR family NAD(P)-dependent oxidoreductase, partial [Gaiellaceae bacterium]|nr:SDR family NAD(P)-dependent oxidoreductase [Gaiellaceae bacterium]